MTVRKLVNKITIDHRVNWMSWYKKEPSLYLNKLLPQLPVSPIRQKITSFNIMIGRYY